MQRNLKSVNSKIIGWGPWAVGTFARRTQQPFVWQTCPQGGFLFSVSKGHMAFIHFSALKMICCQETYRDRIAAGSVVCCFHSYPFQSSRRSAARTRIKMKDLLVLPSVTRCWVYQNHLFYSIFERPLTKNTAIYHVFKCQMQKVSKTPLFTGSGPS